MSASRFFAFTRSVLAPLTLVAIRKDHRSAIVPASAFRFPNFNFVSRRVPFSFPDLTQMRKPGALRR